VHLQTNIDASGNVADFSGSIFVQLTVDGFQDANGNPHQCDTAAGAWDLRDVRIGFTSERRDASETKAFEEPSHSGRTYL
jgi:hypothetical protein